MFLPFALAALSAVATPSVPKTSIKDVKVGIREGKVSFHIKGNKPINMKKVTAHNGDKMMIIWVRDAKLGAPTKTFRHRGVTIKAHQHKTSVELDVVYKKELQCAGAIALKTSTRGIRALSQCEKVPNALTLAANKRKGPKNKRSKKSASLAVTETQETLSSAKVTDAADEPQEDKAEVNPLSMAAMEADTVIQEEKTSSATGFAAILVPVLLLFGMSGLILWLRKKLPQNKKSPGNFNVLKTTHLSPKRSIMVAEVEGHKLILASCENGIQLLKDLPLESPEKPQVTSTKPTPTPQEEVLADKPVLGLVPPPQEANDNILAWPKSGLHQTPSLDLVGTKPEKESAFEQMLTDTAEDELLRRKIQTSRDLFLA